jgi:selenide,water dikinase
MPDTDTIRLTKFAKRAGCAAKQPPDYLLSLLAGLPPITDPNVLVGHATADDAAIYRISDDLALILTTDFFTPIVDRPYDFGAVAAANALSDVYAMAGTPVTALSIVGFPSGALPPGVLVEILRGAIDKAHEAGIAIVGGHTIQSEEPIFGLAVVGRVNPRDVISNAGARPGDFLVLSKPLGLGIITTAAKRDEDPLRAISEALGVMTTLNRDAAQVIAGARAHALTDVTGFGLLGHLRNLAAASGVSATIWNDLVPVLPAARDYVRKGVAPGGTHANRRFLAKWVEYDSDLAEWEQLLLCDAQTSGGLLAAVPGTHAPRVVRELQQRGLASAAVIGSIDHGQPGRIHVHRAPESMRDEAGNHVSTVSVPS